MTLKIVTNRIKLKIMKKCDDKKLSNNSQI